MPAAIRTQCSWCHAVVDVTGTPQHCPDCGHRADLPRLLCTCRRCAPPSITCPKCGRTSHHPQDVARRYCGACHELHDAMTR